MSVKTAAFSFVIGAALGSTFNPTVSKGESLVKRLGKAVSNIKGDEVYKTGAAFFKLRDRIRTTRGEMRKAESDLEAMKNTAKATGGANRLLARRIAQTETRIKSLKASYKRSTSALLSNRAAMRSMGHSLGDVAAKYRKATAESDRFSKAQERQIKITKRQAVLSQKRAKYRSQMVSTAAVGAVVAAPIIAAARAGRSATRLGTVLNSDNKAQAKNLAGQSARELAKTGLSTLGEAFDIQYALNSAGMDAGLARAASGVVAKVATVTSGSHERVAEVIATAYNNLGSAMEGPAEQKISRLGDLMTKVQLKFQIKDFNQFGQSMSEGASGLANYNVNLEQGVTLLGQLNTAGLQGSRAGTALNAVLRQLPKAQDKLGFDIVRDSKGQLDMIATLKSLNKELDGLSTDERAVLIQQMFGDEGARGVVPLLNKLDELDAALKDVTEGSKGIVDREVLAFQEDTLGQWNRMTNTAIVVADAFGNVLLPGVNAVLSVVAGGLSIVGDFASEHETLTTVVGTVVVGFVALRMTLLAFRYVTTLVQGSIFGVQTAIELMTASGARARLVTIALGAAQKAWAIGSVIVTGATAAVTTGFNVLKLALLTNPVGLIVTGIALAAGLLIANWEPAQKFFLGMWEGFSEGVGWAWDKLKKFASWVMSVPVLGDLLKLGGQAVSFMFGGSESPSAPVSAMPPMPAAASGGYAPASGDGVTLNFPINLGNMTRDRAESLGNRIEKAVRRVLPEIIAEERRLALN